MTAARLIRLQCYEGLDKGKALYEWNYQKQLLRIQADNVGTVPRAGNWADLESGIFTEDLLVPRPLLDAIRSPEPVVLLIDEVDRLDIDAEALLLEILSDYQVSIRGIGTVSGLQIPMVFLTSNSSRDLGGATAQVPVPLHRLPAREREREIVRTRVPGISEHLAEQIAAIVSSLRRLVSASTPRWRRPWSGPRRCSRSEPRTWTQGWSPTRCGMLLSYQSDIESACSQLSRGRCLDPKASPRSQPPEISPKKSAPRSQPPRKSAVQDGTACMHRASAGVPESDRAAHSDQLRVVSAAASGSPGRPGPCRLARPAPGTRSGPGHRR